VTAKKITVCLKMNAEQLKEKFGGQLKDWISGSKIRMVGPERWVAIQSPHFQALGLAGCWELAATLHLPINTIDMREAFR
jgi:hypothetical protein